MNNLDILRNGMRKTILGKFASVMWRSFLIVFWGNILLFPCALANAQASSLRIGFFPNITHAHALLMQSFARQGHTEFSIPGVTLEWKAFNAGPSAMEALYAGAVDASFVGPSPVLNAFLRAGGAGVRVVSGAVRGGAGLVVPQDSDLKAPKDFRGKRIATPQLGNTQDIACRTWLLDAGLAVSLGGGDVRVLPTANPDQLPLFLSGRVDAVWTVEPWLSRLLMDGGGRLIYAEPVESCVVTVLAAGEKFLGTPELDALLKLHQAVNAWMVEHPDEAQRRVAEELSRITRGEFPLELVQSAWPRMLFRTDISAEDFTRSFDAAARAGFLKDDGNSRARLPALIYNAGAGEQ